MILKWVTFTGIEEKVMICCLHFCFSQNPFPSCLALEQLAQETSLSIKKPTKLVMCCMFLGLVLLGVSLLFRNGESQYFGCTEYQKLSEKLQGSSWLCLALWDSLLLKTYGMEGYSVLICLAIMGHQQCECIVIETSNWCLSCDAPTPFTRPKCVDSTDHTNSTAHLLCTYFVMHFLDTSLLFIYSHFGIPKGEGVFVSYPPTQ